MAMGGVESGMCVCFFKLKILQYLYLYEKKGHKLNILVIT